MRFLILLTCLVFHLPIGAAEFFYTIQSVDNGGKEVQFSDGSTYTMGWWYSSVPKNWKEGQRVELSYHATYSNCMKLKNIDTHDVAWGVHTLSAYQEKQLHITRIPNGSDNSDRYKTVVLNNGFIFRLEKGTVASSWLIGDSIIILHNAVKSRYDLWNSSEKKVIYNWTFLGSEKQQGFDKIEFENILDLQETINQRIINQEQAVHHVWTQLLNYSAGIHNPDKPVGVFLFIGPTGVGKTELVKVVTDELYHSQQHLVRFDMSHFTEPHSVARLIGSPPGYVNHEEGGQLSEALKKRPQSVVLLDEIEKAHPQIQKVFLPIFDEGYIVDAKDNRVSCTDALFVMTSNLFSLEIAKMWSQGYTEEEIIREIEPALMQYLSPELYNRLEVVLFRPLDLFAMKSLVKLSLQSLVERLQSQKELFLEIDESVHQFLIKDGYHPSLGARPLKKLIEKSLVPVLAQALIKDEYESGATLRLSYSNGQVRVD